MCMVDTVPETPRKHVDPDSGTIKTPVDGCYPLPALVFTMSKFKIWFGVASDSGILEDLYA